MCLESSIDIRHHLLHEAFLHEYRLEEARKPRAEDGVHAVLIVELHEGSICAFRLKIAQKHRCNGTHALTIPAFRTAQGEAVEDMEQRALAEASSASNLWERR